MSHRPHRACDEHTRAELARRAFAEAGRGLPAVEPGMPAPAGTGLSRRSFLSRSAGLAMTVYGAQALGGLASPRLEQGIAAASTGAAGAEAPVLVSVFLDGGIDSLSVLAPVEDPTYRRMRPKLALDPDAGVPVAGDERLRWHPDAAPLAELQAEGKLAVAPAIGYSDADQSHFTSRHYWEVGQLDTGLRTGWMGRLLDEIGATDNPLQGLALDGRLAPTLAAARVPVAATWEGNYDLYAPGVWGDVERLMFKSFERIGAKHERRGKPGLADAGRVARQAGQLRRQLDPFDQPDGPPAGYPDDGHFSRSLASLATMLDGGLPIRCVALTAPGAYDTHDNQVDDFREGLGETASVLAAFQQDLERRNLDRRVITVVWSEFGRRPEENGSYGTDHGAGGCAFVLGSRVRSQLLGEWPGLDRLDEDDNMRSTLDFRALYAALIEQWFETDAAAVLGDVGFQRPQLLR